ncbi:MAG: DM9 repeat-containing protein [Polyangiales bacterium]
MSSAVLSCVLRRVDVRVKVRGLSRNLSAFGQITRRVNTRRPQLRHSTGVRAPGALVLSLMVRVVSACSVPELTIVEEPGGTASGGAGMTTSGASRADAGPAPTAPSDGGDVPEPTPQAGMDRPDPPPPVAGSTASAAAGAAAAQGGEGGAAASGGEGGAAASGGAGAPSPPAGGTGGSSTPDTPPKPPEEDAGMPPTVPTRNCLAWRSHAASNTVPPEGAVEGGGENIAGVMTKLYVCRFRPQGHAYAVPGKLVAGFGCYVAYRNSTNMMAQQSAMNGVFDVLTAAPGCSFSWQPATNTQLPENAVDLGDPSGGPNYACRGFFSNTVTMGIHAGAVIASRDTPPRQECWFEAYNSANQPADPSQFEALVLDPL